MATLLKRKKMSLNMQEIPNFWSIVVQNIFLSFQKMKSINLHFLHRKDWLLVKYVQL